MATFLAVSTWNFELNGYTVYGKSSNKKQALKEAKKRIETKPDAYVETLLVNLQVMSKTKAKKYGIVAEDLILYEKEYIDINNAI